MERQPFDHDLTIQDVSILLKVPKSTLRYWEQAFGSLIKPLRTSGGQRRYGQEQIDLFRKIVALKKDGRKIAQIKEILDHAGTSHHKTDIKEKETVESLANRIAVLVNQEVKKFFENSSIVKL